MLGLDNQYEVECSFKEEVVAKDPFNPRRGQITKQFVTWKMPVSIDEDQKIWLNVIEAFQNPATSEKTTTFILNIYTDEDKGTKLDY